MIILPEEEEQLPKLASPPPVHPVNRRPSTPTPSLPDYETSQQQEQKHVDVQKKPSRLDFLSLLSRRWRIAFWGLIAYFVVTIAIGVPIIVMKSRPSAQYNKNPSMLYPSPAAWGSKNGSGIYGFNLGQFPVDVDDATSCDNWDYKDRWDNGVFKARLQYNIPVDNTVWIQSNATALPITQTSPVTGSLSVGISQDPTDTEATVKIVMSYNDQDVRYRTSVCVMNLLGSDGVYLSVPPNLKGPDHLDFKITVTLPQPTSPKKPRHIANFLTYLPYFAQYISPVSPRLTFGSVALGGWKSNVTIDYMQAEAMLVKTPYANFNGMLNITNDDDADDYS